ncbi:MAG TPA: prepilin-type N-terminal cleavage/methylation domain-containing protein [Candidatus Paceibacterota bacterium]|nr:prepilin-type N-terminal cleavage/methylation domain-containing protein [Candidatus Paceibacterota bacterium]
MSKERLHTKQAGFSLVEVILASSVFMLFVTALVGVWLYGQEATVLAGNRARAVMLAEEGLEAVRNIRDGSSGISGVADGSFGLSIASNQWNLSGSSDTVNNFTRQIVISTIDARRKLVTSNVTWQQNPQRTGSVSLSSYLNAWQCEDQATLLTVDTSAVGLTSANRNLVGITVANSGVGCGDLVIDRITVSWTPTTGNRRIQDILSDAISVWSGSEITGTLLDISNTTLVAGASALSTEYQFSNNMNNRVFTIIYTMGDGSEKTVSGISP